ncbi:hypothetical protein [Phyllobacterium sp. 22552]|uniref:hypothetical protein n=1 Tax=Phyllobacterium sp. 22552 TaxID=3453941 RepID=UPI003F83754D
MKLSKVVVCFLTLATTGCATTYEGRGLTDASKVSGNVTVKSGRMTYVDQLLSYDEACREGGPVSMKVIKLPKNGKIGFSTVRNQPVTLPRSAKFYHCNNKKLMHINAVYMSKPGFVGNDSVTIRNLGVGFTQDVTAHITVTK